MVKIIQNKATGGTLIKWLELEDLQPENLKVKKYSDIIRQSIIELGFASPFVVWVDPVTQESKIADGHGRHQILKELISEGYKVPDELPCTFLDNTKIKTEQEAVKYLLRVFNTKTNPIDSIVLEDWLEEIDLTMEEVFLEDASLLLIVQNVCVD